MVSQKRVLTGDMLQADMFKQFVPGKVTDGSVGFELEIWPFRKTKANGAGLIKLNDETGTGLVQVLKMLEGRVAGLRYEPGYNGLDRFVIGNGGQLTFEPGGQLEYSGPPLNTLGEAITDLNSVLEELRCNLKPFDIWLFHSGLNPWHSLDEIGLHLQTARYQNMDKFFAQKGPYGRKMMRQSTSLQLNVDTGSKDVMGRRWLAANLMSAPFIAMFGNSPFVDGKPTGYYSYRTKIIQSMDPSRTGFPKGLLHKEYCPCPAQQYLDLALNADNLRLPDLRGEMVFDGNFRSFQQWMDEGYNGYFPDEEDWKVHVSTIFPEVRVRGFLELRYLDAQSKVWCAVPAILLTHLIYDEETREKAIELMMPFRTAMTEMVETAARVGLDHDEIAEVSKKLYRLAMDVLVRKESTQVADLCELFYEKHTHSRSNPAKELLRLNGGEVFTPDQYRDFEESQIDRAGSLLNMICGYC